MNAIGTQLRDPINSGLTQWRMAVSMGPLFPIGIENLIYVFFCYGSSNGYQGHINIGSSAPDWPGSVQKHADTSTTLKKQVNRHKKGVNTSVLVSTV